jgi:hypothetical protein
MFTHVLLHNYFWFWFWRTRQFTFIIIDDDVCHFDISSLDDGVLARRCRGGYGSWRQGAGGRVWSAVDVGGQLAGGREEEAQEGGRGPAGAGLELGMELSREEEGVVLQLDDLQAQGQRRRICNLYDIQKALEVVNEKIRVILEIDDLPYMAARIREAKLQHEHQYQP